MGVRRRVVLLAMDAGDRSLLARWAAAGVLKNLRELLDGGLVGDTVSMEGFVEGATWPSFYTGLTPARHGFYRVRQLAAGTYERSPWIDGAAVTGVPFWDHLSAAGRKVAILDVPLSCISEGLNGIQMVEWGSHDRTCGFRTWPVGLKRDVAARFGRHPLRYACDAASRTSRGMRSFRDSLIQGVARKAALTEHYLKRDRWDFFGQVFTESHCVGHQCWHLHDAAHPSYDASIAAAVGDPIRDVYEAVDRAIGRTMAGLDSSTVLVFLASHGMSHNFGAQFLLREMLLRLGVTKPNSSVGRPLAEGLNPLATLNSLLTWGWRQTPAPVRDRLGTVRSQVRSWVDHSAARSRSAIKGIDFAASSCFPLDNGTSVGGIRVNLAGREPEGIVEPGREMDEFCEALAQSLLRIVHCDTGKPALKSVKRTDRLYRGDCLARLPDLLVEWNDEHRIGSAGTGTLRGSRARVASEEIGTLEGTYRYCRTGDHRPEGLFAVYGHGIEAGHLQERVSIMDLAPTIARLLDVELPDIDGKVIGAVADACGP